jgi:hypothetical protein
MMPLRTICSSIVTTPGVLLRKTDWWRVSLHGATSWVGGVLPEI